MSRTLFWYIFGALFRAFVLTTAGLSGMLSFAVLLRPLTEHGLDFGQVVRLLAYAFPAVCAYSLPVSALFATTMIYGRFSADNELTAMRAMGISYFSARRFSISLPAVVLGLVVALISMVLLCYIVPAYSLRMEEVIDANIARVIASSIEQTHALPFQDSTGRSFNVYADAAKVVPYDPAHSSRQRVELIGPAALMQYDYAPNDATVAIPREFWMAQRAWVSIDRESASKPMMITVSLDGGIKFPRVFYGNVQVGVHASGFGPFEIPSLIRENVKFMDIGRLAQLAQDPSQSEDVQYLVRRLQRNQQQITYLARIADAINHRAADGTSSYQFAEDSEGDIYEIGARDAKVEWRGDYLVIAAPGAVENRTVWMRQTHGSQLTLYVDTKELDIHAQPNSAMDAANSAPADRINVSLEMFNANVQTQGGVQTPRGSLPRGFSVPMPPEIQAFAHKSLTDFLEHDPHANLGDPPQNNGKWVIDYPDYFSVNHNEIRAKNAARSELHGRASFALSCLSLVLVGAALGVMFRSGNFLNAFAASFVPALLCMTLIISGQQTATHVPYTAIPEDPLRESLMFIWSGNVAVFLAAIYLTFRLQRR